MAEGHMVSKSWSKLCVLDQIMAHIQAFPHNFLKVKDLPSHLQDMFKRHSSFELSLMMGEHAFKADIILMMATWKFAKVMESCIITLESK